jgi:hypothetical protein
MTFYYEKVGANEDNEEKTKQLTAKPVKAVLLRNVRGQGT